jgi:alpha-tubulin suppressor-like RCC1 family protein
LNNFGQLGDGTDKSSSVPVAVPGLTAVGSIVGESAQGGYCAALVSGGVDCWGTNTLGALGNGSTTLAQADVPVAVTGISDVKTVVSNEAYTYCALLIMGDVRCWGSNEYGQLGDGSAVAYSNVPVGVGGVVRAVGLVSDSTGFCAQLKVGGVECWGSNSDGLLGDGSTVAFSNVAVSVPGMSYVQDLFSAGGGYCAVMDGGGVKCWGSDSDGTLGDGRSSGYSAVPVAVKGVSGAVSVHGSCAVLKKGGVKCWGPATDGDLGNGTSGQQSDVAVTVKGLSGVASLAGRYCALLKNGAVDCWGSNSDGALGNGATKTFSAVPVEVKGITDSMAVRYDANGGGGYCEAAASGAVLCWGSNYYGALGNGGTEVISSVPVEVVGFGS